MVQVRDYYRGKLYNIDPKTGLGINPTPLYFQMKREEKYRCIKEKHEGLVWIVLLFLSIFLCVICGIIR